MKHIALFIYILSLSTGYASFIVALLFYQKLKKHIFIHYGLFMLSLSLIVLGLAVNHYGKIAIDLNLQIIELLSSNISMAGSILCVFATPTFFFSLFGIKVSQLKKIIFIALNITMLLSAILYKIVENTIVFEIIAQIVLFGIIGYTIGYGIINRNNIGNIELTKKMYGFKIISLCFFPFLIADSVIKNFTLIPYNLTTTLFFFVASLLSIRFAFQYLDQPAYYKKGELTKHFTDNFNITKRESEIILEILEGLSNKEISEKLFISYKTVENHLSNIYQKIGVKNRVQLNNLVQSNRE